MQFDMNFQSVEFISNTLVRISYRMKLKKINTINFFLIIDRYSGEKISKHINSYIINNKYTKY